MWLPCTPPTSLHQWSATLDTSQSGRAVGGRQEVHWKHSFRHDNYRGAINLPFLADQLPRPPLLPANGAVFKQQGQNSTAGCALPLCFVALSSGTRGRQKEKQDSPEHIRAGLTLAAAVIYLFWPSLRQFHVSVSVGEHLGPRLTLLPRVLRNKTQRTLVQASASKVPQAPVRGTQVDQLMSQLLIETSSNSFMPSLCPTPGIISPVFSALQARKQLRWGFHKPRVPPLNLKVVQGIQSWEGKSGQRVSPPPLKGNHILHSHTAEFIFNPTGSLIPITPSTKLLQYSTP